MDNTKLIPLSWIIISKQNPRRTTDEAGLQELAESIKTQGVLQPIIVREIECARAGTGNRSFEIVCGERRYRAANMAGLQEIPAIIRELSDHEAIQIAVIENLQREDVGAIQEARGYKTLMGPNKGATYSVESIADKVGKTAAYIASRLRLLDLPAKVQLAIENGLITPGHGAVIARLNSEDEQARLFDAIVEGKLSIRAAENDLNNFGKELSRASFDTTQCAVCPKNGSEQKDFFDADTNLAGRCLDLKCFEEKSAKEMDRRKKELTKKGNKVETEEQIKKRAKGYDRHCTQEIGKKEGEILGTKYGLKCRKCASRVHVIESMNPWDDSSPQVITERCLKPNCYAKLTMPAPDPAKQKKDTEKEKAEQEKKEAFERLKKDVTGKLTRQMKLAVLVDLINVNCYFDTDEIFKRITKKSKPDTDYDLEFILGLKEETLEKILFEFAPAIITEDDNTLQIIAAKLGISTEK